MVFYKRRVKVAGLSKMVNSLTDAEYTMGRSVEEAERLIEQSKIYESITQGFFKNAGITKGMKVLDIGSGSGDVALILAEMVGESGKVVGIDVNGQILETARDRVKKAGFANVTFIEGDSRNIELSESFDAVVGRLVLMYISDPSSALKKFKTYLKPDGILAFQELDFSFIKSLKHPDTPLFNQLAQWVYDVFQRSGAHGEIGLNLNRIFIEAGLPAPMLNISAPLGGGEKWAGYKYVTHSFQSLLPLLEKYEIATASEVGLDTLTERIRQEAITSKRPLVLSFHVTAFSKLSS